MLNYGLLLRNSALTIILHRDTCLCVAPSYLLAKGWDPVSVTFHTNEFVHQHTLVGKTEKLPIFRCCVSCRIAVIYITA